MSNLIVNGSFEDDLTTWSTTYLGWSFTYEVVAEGNLISVWGGQFPCPAPHQGVKMVHGTNLGGQSWLYKNVPSESGHVYRLSFWLNAVWSYWNSTGYVEFNGQQIMSFEHPHGSPSTGEPSGWINYTVDFVAPVASGQLKIALTNMARETLLDDITLIDITPPPPPEHAEPIIHKLGCMLLGVQANTETPNDVLGANDFMNVLEQPRHEIETDIEPDRRSSGKFLNNPPTRGRMSPDISLPFSLYSRGAGKEPSFIRALRCAGFERVLHDNYVRMRPRETEFEAGTAWGFSGNRGVNKCLLSKYGNVMFDGTINMEAGKRVTLQLNGKGKVVATPVVATMPNVDHFREGDPAPALLGATYLINGKAYGMIRASIAFGQAIENKADARDGYCGGGTEITKRIFTWTATVFAKANPGLIPHDSLKRGLTGIWNFEWGKVHNKPDCQIYAPRSTITKVKPGSNNGMQTWDLGGIFEDNDLEIRIFNGTLSSYSSASDSASSDSDSSASASGSSSSLSSMAAA